MALEELKSSLEQDLLKATPRDYESFVEDSAVWHDMENTIKDRINILTDELINAEEREEVIKLQSEIRCWRELIALPQYLLEHAKLEQELKEQNNA